MAEYIPDITIPSDEYVSINTLSGVDIGTEMVLQLKSTVWIRLVESATKPAASVEDGLLMSNLTQNYASATIRAGSLEVWAISTKTNYNASSKLNVQEI